MKLPHNHGQHIDEVLSRLPHTDDFQLLAEIFKQLGDGNRIRIFWLLCHCEECVMNLSAILEMSSPAVSHHLRQLKNAGLIQGNRIGKEVYYKAVDSDASRLFHEMIEQMMEISCPDTKEKN